MRACLSELMTIGFVQHVNSRGMFVHRIGSRNTVPPSMLRMVPFGDFHIVFSLNSVTPVHTPTRPSTLTFDTRLVGRDRGTFDAHMILLYGMRSVDSHCTHMHTACNQRAHTPRSFVAHDFECSNRTNVRRHIDCRAPVILRAKCRRP